MSAFFLAVFFILGSVVASFMGVVVARLYTGASIVHGRSECDSCGRTLRVVDLVPIFSFLLFRGRARCCATRISCASTIAEVVLGTLFALSYLKLDLTFPLAFLLVGLAVLLALVLYDIRHSILPPVLLGIFLLASIGFSVVTTPSMDALIRTVLVAGAMALFLALLHYGSGGRAMGLADAPLVFGLALFGGPTALSGFILSFWIGALFGILVLARRPRGARMGIEVPFAPFLASGFLLAYLTAWDPFAAVAALVARFMGA